MARSGDPSDTTIAGFIIAESDGAEAHIITIDIAESCRRAGVGTALLREMERRLAARGVRRVSLETATTNEPAVAFWQRHGYRSTGVLPGYYLGRLDAYSMSKKLVALRRIRHPMTLWHAVVLAVVQGLTEFLPISSSAHLWFFPWAFGWPDGGIPFDVALHAGTLVAVVLYFLGTWVELVLNGFGVRYPASASQEQVAANRRLFWLLVIGTIPGAIVGFFFEHFIEETWRNPGPHCGGDDRRRGADACGRGGG